MNRPEQLPMSSLADGAWDDEAAADDEFMLAHVLRSLRRVEVEEQVQPSTADVARSSMLAIPAVAMRLRELERRRAVVRQDRPPLWSTTPQARAILADRTEASP